MSADRPGTPDDGGTDPKRSHPRRSGAREPAAGPQTPLRRKRWFQPDQPASPEDADPLPGAAQGSATRQPSATAPTDTSPSRAAQPGTDHTAAHPDANPQSSAPRQPSGPASTEPRPYLPCTPPTPPTGRFPTDPGSPVPLRLRHRYHEPRDPSVAAVWQRSDLENRRFATRFAGRLLLIGAGLGVFLTLVLGARDGVFSAGWFGFMGACAVAAVWGLIYVLLPKPAPDLVLRATPAASALLITFTLALNHSDAASGMLLLTWPLLFAAYLLPRRTAYWTLAVVVVCLTVVLLAGTGPARFAAWVETTTSVALTLLVILQVRAQTDRLKKVLAQQATTDPLTGLGNRRAFDAALEREVTRQRRTRAPLSLLAVDVDHFKQINDTWGHAAGDDTLAALGDLLTRLVRASDTVSRVGGEEFGVLLPDCPAAQAIDRANTLRAEVYAASRAWTHPVTVSVGVATLPDSADASNDLVVAADTALYAAKESGRDRVRAAPMRRRDDVP